MSKKTLVYWIGIIGIPGKGPHYMEPYDPNRTIGQIIQTMTSNGHVERNKRVEIFKFQPGNLNKYNIAKKQDFGKNPENKCIIAS
jgi:hypothetical protein